LRSSLVLNTLPIILEIKIAVKSRSNILDLLINAAQWLKFGLQFKFFLAIQKFVLNFFFFDSSCAIAQTMEQKTGGGLLCI